MSQHGIEVVPDQPQREHYRHPLAELKTYGHVNRYSKEAETTQRESLLSKAFQGNPSRRYGLVWIIGAALAGALVVAAAVGGGLGSQLNSCQNERKTANTQATNDTELQICKANSSILQTSLNNCLSGAMTSASNYTVLSPTAVQSLYWNCPLDHNTDWVTTPIWGSNSSSTFRQLCNVVYDEGKRGAHGLGNVTHIMSVFTYSFEDCMGACNNYNTNQILYSRQNTTSTGSGNLCYTVSWANFMRSPGNCFLLNDTAANPADVDTMATGWESAYLSQLNGKSV